MYMCYCYFVIMSCHTSTLFCIFLLGTKFDMLAFESKDQLIDMPLMIEPT